jgi:uncharacterized membrane protein YphA (DoxX/SURF4 family)
MTLAIVITGTAIVLLIGFGGLLAVASIASGLGKIARHRIPVEVLTRVGVPAERIPVLGALQVLGGLGVVLGIWVPVLGVLAALSLTLYYLGAIFAHLRIKDTVSGMAPALFLFVIALITTVLETAR